MSGYTVYAFTKPSKQCDGCGGEWDAFQFKQKTWLLIARHCPPHGGYLCLACAEKRLGRLLTIDDFTKAPINEPIRFGYRMRMREDE